MFNLYKRGTHTTVIALTQALLQCSSLAIGANNAETSKHLILYVNLTVCYFRGDVSLRNDEKNTIVLRNARSLPSIVPARLRRIKSRV